MQNECGGVRSKADAEAELFLSFLESRPAGGSVATLAYPMLVGFEVTKPRRLEFTWRPFEPEFILMAVGWYLRFSLSYRDVEELLLQRSMSGDVSVGRWVQRYAPELDRRLRSLQT
jgi:hypothetical protein